MSRFTLILGKLAYPLQAGRSYSLGQDPHCEIRIGHSSIRPRHARLLVEVEQVRVQVGEEKPGTWVPGQTLHLGELTLQLQLTAAASSSFEALVAEELRRTPWLALSILCHALLFFLLWLWAEENPTTDWHLPTVSLESAKEDQVTEQVFEDIEPMPEVQPVQEQPLQDEEVQDQDEAATASPGAWTEFEAPELDGDLLLGKMRQGSDGEGDILKLGKAALSGGFKNTVSKLRKDGLEIMFVLDSTGSMERVLRAAKERIARMVEVLHALVPHARIGMVTYRDHGRRETYLTRSIPLSLDLYRCMNFMQDIHAGGGGDQPEAVHEALQVAFQQKWHKQARRVVILIGDAPPHPKNLQRLEDMVQGFAKDGRSFLHTIVTAAQVNEPVDQSTLQTFGDLAQNGSGECLTFADEGKILRSVLALAFGRKYSRSLDAVYQEVADRSQQTPPEALALVRRAKRHELRKELSKRPVADELVQALIRRPNKEALTHLITFMRERNFSAPGRHAAAYVLLKALQLRFVPMNPETNQPLSPVVAKDLLQRIRQM